MNEITVCRGTSFTRSLRILIKDGESLTPYVHRQDDIVTLTVKHNVLQSEPDIRKAASYDSETDTYTFEFSPSDTENLVPDRYYYDIGLQNDDDFYIVVPLSNFDILPTSSQRSVE